MFSPVHLNVVLGVTWNRGSSHQGQHLLFMRYQKMSLSGQQGHSDLPLQFISRGAALSVRK